eukprot:m.205370 g.205370  ORF g.205370 m.205370 type:complete len:394 (+) comp32913_c0_seq1:221-1402(+)
MDTMDTSPTTNYGQHRLVLHFDVNKTLIIEDAAGGMSIIDMLNSILCEHCWGNCIPESVSDQNPIGWTAKYSAPTEVKPDQDIKTVTFADAVEHLPRSERKRFKKQFTNPGQPGEQYFAYLKQLDDALQLPEHLVQRARDASIEKLSHGRFFILPSFFTLILDLEQKKRDFAIVFRTFGTDIPEITEEWNLFCEGKHPVFPGVRLDGSGSRPDRRLYPPFNTGSWMRYSDPNGLHDGVALSAVSSESLLVTTCKGRVAAHNMIADKLRCRDGTWGASLALKDDFGFWNESGESDTSGKLLLVENLNTFTGPKNEFEHEIFFDDNIERDRMHIVDVRDRETGLSKRYIDAINVNAVRAVPTQAIVDRNYFISSLQRCEQELEKTRGTQSTECNR